MKVLLVVCTMLAVTLGEPPIRGSRLIRARQPIRGIPPITYGSAPRQRFAAPLPQQQEPKHRFAPQQQEPSFQYAPQQQEAVKLRFAPQQQEPSFQQHEAPTAFGGQGYPEQNNDIDDTKSNEPITIGDLINQQQNQGYQGGQAFVVPSQISFGATPNQVYGAPSGNRRPAARPAKSQNAATQVIFRPSAQYRAEKFPVQQQQQQVTQTAGYLPQTVANEVDNVGYSYGQASGSDEGSQEGASYEYEYIVNDAKSGNDFGHREARQNNVVQGSYFVQLPDGRRQLVEYEADEHGYRPRVTYEGEAQFPTQVAQTGGNQQYGVPNNQGYERAPAAAQSGYDNAGQNVGYRTNEVQAENNGGGYRY